MSRQDQDVRDGSLAIQSGRDTTIHQGLSPAQMKEIMEAIASQLPGYAAIAREIVDQRLQDFGQRIIAKFADTSSTRSEAFKDPDFQYVVTRAQNAYARSGDEQVREALVDLIARRSREMDRTRLSLSLDEAVEKAALLTRNEFAELSCVYLIKYTRKLGIASLADLAQHLNRNVIPLLPDVSNTHSSYWYLEAQACAKIEMGSIGLYDLLKRNYSGVLTSGFDRGQLEAHLPDGNKNALDALVMPCLNDHTRLQFAALSREIFHEKAGSSGLEKRQLDNVYNLMENSVWPQDELIRRLTPLVPGVGLAFELWDRNKPLSHLSLTSVGIAIGHANLVRVAGLDADLSIWID